MSDYGVDSLMAVELRNGIGKDYEAEVAVFDVLGGASIADIGQLEHEKGERKVKRIRLGPVHGWNSHISPCQRIATTATPIATRSCNLPFSKFRSSS